MKDRRSVRQVRRPSLGLEGIEPRTSPIIVTDTDEGGRRTTLKFVRWVRLEMEFPSRLQSRLL